MASNLKRLACAAAILSLSGVCGATYLDTMTTLDAKIQLANKQSELNTAIRQSAQTVYLPTVRSVVVDEKGASAQVVYKSGASRWVRSGDVLSGGIKVGSITPNGVMAKTKKGEAPLEFYSDNSATPEGIQVGGVDPSLGMPPMPIRAQMQTMQPPVTAQQPVVAGAAPQGAPALPVAAVPAH